MTEPSDYPESTPNRFALSGTQQWLCAGDAGEEAGTFGRLFTSEIALRVSGRMDVAALQCALDDIVRRHEMLRTIVVRDAQPRYQQVYPPAPATLDVRDLPPASEESRDVRVQEIILRAGRRGMDVLSLPLLRGELNRFDDQDSVLVVTTHHTAADGWSMHVVMRELATLYKARVTGRPADLPSAPQYRDFVAWERARIAGPDAEISMKYWREKLNGARIFALPSDHSFSGPHSRPYSAYYFSITPEVMEKTAALSAGMRSSVFMIMLAAFNVLAWHMTGTVDPVINTFSSGRNDPEIEDIVGAIANPLPLRTDIDDCVTFRDVIGSTRRTCLEAYSHQIPAECIEREAPDLMAPISDPMLCNIVFSMPQPHVDGVELEFADGSYEVRKEIVQHEPESVDLAGGAIWDMDLLPSHELTGTLRFNLDDFNEETIIAWASAFSRILSSGVLDPDGEWKKL